ncbi:hypothetical protein WJX72_003868 [[Myrmecia] bisecta]|uniref:Uncharacterized protein n=1 Tax=[Myrmecia] bisecta TaxID=41462 RepID=A0AAW1QEQ9_9CHLO
MLHLVKSLFTANPVDSPQLQSAKRQLGADEVASLRSGFIKLQDNTSHGKLDKDAFLALLGCDQLDGWLGEQLLRVVSCGSGQGVDFEAVVVAKAICCQGTGREVGEFCFNLLDAHQTGKITPADLEHALLSCLD